MLIVLARWVQRRFLDVSFLAILFMIAVAYFQLRSISLEDWDAGSFAIYVRDGYTSARLYVPYVLFVITGRQLHLATGADAILILTSLSSVSAVAVLACQYATTILLLKEKQVALLATLLLAFSNQFWLPGEEAVSDMFALSLTSVAVLLAVLAWRRGNQPLLFASSLAFGISVGARITQIMFLGIPFVLAMWALPKRKLAIVPVGIAIGVICWLVPCWLYYPEVFNSFRSLFPTTGNPLGVLQTTPTAFAGPPTLQGLLYRFVDWGLVRNYLLYNYGAWFYPQVPALRVVVTLGLIVAVAIFACANYFKSYTRVKMLYAIWIVPYFISSNLAWEISSEPKVILQILPPISAILAFSLLDFSRAIAEKLHQPKRLGRVLRTGIPALFLCLLLAFTFSNALALHSQRSGVDAIADYIRANYTPSQVRIIYAWEWTRLAYYIPQYVEYNLWVIDPSNWPIILQALNESNVKVILITGQAINLVMQMAQQEGYMLQYREIFSHTRSDLVNSRDGTDTLYLVTHFAKALGQSLGP